MTTRNSRIRVGVVFGGRSGEHDVSLRSAQTVIGALEASGHEIIPIGITREGAWLTDGDPMQALQAATCNAAKFLGKFDDVGSIQPGKLADLVLLSASPLENIRNTRRIAAVISGGRLVPR